MAREIVLDTETTGLDPKTGHRVIEIACIEVEDLLPTGRHFHLKIDPERDIDPMRSASTASAGPPCGARRSSPIRSASRCSGLHRRLPTGAHNAAFDRGFVNMEMERAGRPHLPVERWVCTYELAKKRFPAMHNSLDALCKRYKISLAEREKHGALIDTRLLSLVYLELQGGKERALEFSVPEAELAAALANRPAYGPRTRPLAPRSTEAERERHAAWIAATLKGEPIWVKLLADEAAGTA